ncbi:MAG: cytochrome P450 [Leptolyngbya sp. SIO1D8]|nr:cytochrome P450 [Leptolyngbya sp. SIO1D8]
MVLQQVAPTELNKITPPEPPFRLFDGTLSFFGKSTLRLELNRLAKRYGHVYQLHVGGRKVVILNGLEAIREALVKQLENFNTRADFDLYQKPPQCYFLEVKGGEPWKRHRAILGGVMHTYMAGKSELFESWALEEAADLVKVFIQSGGQPVDPGLYVPIATLSFTQRLMFNKKGSYDEPKKDTDFVAVARGMTSLNRGAGNITSLPFIPKIWRPIFMLSRWKPLRNFVRFAAAADSYLLKNIEEHQQSFDPENLRDVTDGLLQACSDLTQSDRTNLGLSENDIINGSLIQFMGAGTEANSVMLRWALLYMIVYPNIQVGIQKELDTVASRDQQISLKHRGKLPFTEACIHEVFRHSAAGSLPAFVYATTANTTLDGYFIPPKTPVLINFYSLTRDERYWPEPEQFNPNRFLDKDTKIRNDLLDKFYPFGVGPRRCIGEYLARLQIFLYFTNLLHKCKFKNASGEKLTLDPLLTSLLSPQDYKVVATPRL